MERGFFFKKSKKVKIKAKDLFEGFPNNSGSFGFDPWGFHIDRAKDSIGFAKFMYEKFFRVEAFGLEHVPKDGRALIISNHSGQIPFDGMLIGYSIMTNKYGARAPKAMIERFFPTVPFIGNYLNRMGAVVGDPLNCARMLEKEEAIIVFPEGVRGGNKVFKNRYKLQRFGKGFVHLAIEHDAPIIPVGVVGCEESVISLADIKSIGKLFGLPTFPIVVPMLFPTKVYIHFGKPIKFDSKTSKSDDVIEEKVDIVKGEIKKLIDLGLNKRERIFEK